MISLAIHVASRCAEVAMPAEVQLLSGPTDTKMHIESEEGPGCNSDSALRGQRQASDHKQHVDGRCLKEGPEHVGQVLHLRTDEGQGPAPSVSDAN